MPVYLLQPHQGVGLIQFGMHRTEVQAAMNLPVETLHKGGESPLVDAYLDSCLQVFYDLADTVEYIELSRDGPVTAMYDDLDVFTTPAEQVVQHIRQHAGFDASEGELGYSYIFPDLDLSVWRPQLPEDGADGQYFATIGIGKPGYYSNPESELESGSASVLNEEVGFNWMLPLFGAAGFGIGFALMGAIMLTIFNLAQNGFAHAFPGTGVGPEVGILRGLIVGAIGGAALGLGFKDKNTCLIFSSTGAIGFAIAFTLVISLDPSVVPDLGRAIIRLMGGPIMRIKLRICSGTVTCKRVKTGRNVGQHRPNPTRLRNRQAVAFGRKMVASTASYCSARLA